MITYNHEKYIRSALDSILSQKCSFKFNIVIGEDCSTDNTREILLEYHNKYPEKFKLLLHNENIGAVNNQNETLKACDGKYIAICEGDDYWTDQYKLQNQVDLIEKRLEATMCVALTNILDSNNLISSLNNQNSNRKTNDLIYFNDIINTYFHTSTYLIKKEFIPFLLSFSEKIQITDTVLRYLLVSKGPFVLYNEVVSVYRITGDGVWTTLSEEKQHLSHYKMYCNLTNIHNCSHTKHYIFRKYIYSKKLSFLYIKKFRFYNAVLYLIKAVEARINYIFN